MSKENWFSYNTIFNIDDALDTLLLLGNHAEYFNDNELLKHYHYAMSRRSSRRKSRISISGGGGMFDLNENASLFEIKTRVLGGLLSTHQLIGCMQETKEQKIPCKDGTNWTCDGFLLSLTKDISDRFLPALRLMLVFLTVLSI